MMEYVREYLMLLRRKNNDTDLKPNFLTRISLVMLISIVIGIIIDILLPFNFAINLIRGVIGLAIAISATSTYYLLNFGYVSYKIKDNKYYEPLRKRLSHRQRVNISLVIGIGATMFALLSGKPSPIYTLKAGTSMTIVFSLIIFARRGRNEFLQDVYEIPDPRDLQFSSELRNLKDNSDKNKDIENK